MTQPKYTPEEAVQRYLDRLKNSDPSPAVQEAIREIEDEMRSRPQKHGHRRQLHEVPTPT